LLALNLGQRYGVGFANRNIARSREFGSPAGNGLWGTRSKSESHRLGSENSEDALSWNVFRSLEEAGLLAAVAKLMTGEDHPQKSNLYLWRVQNTYPADLRNMRGSAVWLGRRKWASDLRARDAGR